jgi:hypothetical protein
MRSWGAEYESLGERNEKMRRCSLVCVLEEAVSRYFALAVGAEKMQMRALLESV